MITLTVIIPTGLLNMKNTMINPCTESDKTYIIDNLVKYNLSKVPANQDELFINLDRKITDESGKIIAGCIARMYCWNVMYIDTLWVDKEYRGQGFGSKLLLEVENKAKEKGCYLSHLDTFDFQAKDFYLNHGYSLFGVLEECPKGHNRYYLKKDLI